MSDPQSMVGELEIQSTAAVLNRSVHVMIDSNDHVSKYNDSAQCAKDPLVVKYTPHADTGHYEATVPESVPFLQFRNLQLPNTKPSLI